MISSTSSRFKLKTLASVIMAATHATVMAQEGDIKEPVIVEEVIVTGIRAAIANSVNDKRTAKNIVDTINAEDIGKSTDQNIAEALNRISGVSINSSDGEGTTISVRGANADQTVVTLNGTALGSTEFSQGVDLSAYSSDILSKIEVVKTPSADHEEGSLGGLVNLTTRKPLDISEDVRSISVQGRYNDIAEEGDYKISGSFSQKFADDRLGFLLTITNERNTVRRDQYHAQDYNSFGSNLYTDDAGNSFGSQAALDVEAAAAAADGRDNVFADVIGVQPFTDRGQWVSPGSEEAYGSIVRALAPGQAGYELHQNERERTGIDLSVQWQIADETDLTFSATVNTQDFNGRMDGTFVATTNFTNIIDTTQQPNLGLGPAARDRTVNYEGNPPELGGLQLDENGVTIPGSNRQFQWTDPQQNWHVLDRSTRTWDTYLNRFSVGKLQSSVNRFETDNSVFQLELNHAFSDTLRMKAGLSVSESKQTPESNIFMIASRNRTVSPWNLHHVPADVLTPSGYDCTSGVCRLVGGTTTPSLGNIVDLVLNSDDLWDNVGTTGFNPDDLNSHSLEFISTGFTEVTDEQDTAFVDFDWDLDTGGITTLEFGVKYTHREKFVDNQSGTPRPGSERIIGTSPFTGEPVEIDPSNLALIQAALFDSGEIDAPGFLSSLDYPTDNVTDGWRSFDPVAALAAVSAGEREFTLDRTETRGAEFDNLAVYFKANFSYLDERLQGDVGIRYVKTEVETSGFAGSVFSQGGVNNGRIIDPIHISKLRAIGPDGILCPQLSETPNPLVFGDASEFWSPPADGSNTDVTDGANYDLGRFVDRNRWARVDGLGFDINNTSFVFGDDIPIPATNNGACYDPLLEAGALPSTFTERNLVRYSDISVDQIYVYDRQIDENGNLVATDRSRLSSPTSGKHEYDLLLPSLNVSFAITDNVIARFAASKTMARPPIDDLRAGYSMSEGNVFQAQAINRPGSAVNLYSAQLDPLESKNIDISLEWYFDESALISANFFAKDYKNLVTVQDTNYYISDLRGLASNIDGWTFDTNTGIIDDGLGNSFSLLLDQVNPSVTPDIDQCMPRRLQGEATLAGNPILYNDDPTLLCDVYRITERINADEATVRGVELQYTQNFHFLPGVLEGLGTTINYTYQKGEFEETKEVIPGAPKDSYNFTLFWASDAGHQARLAWSGSSDVLEQASFEGGSRWREGRQTLDFSADYAVNDNISLQFQAVNLTDEPVRTYFTSRTINLPNADGMPEAFDEGSAINGNAPKNRTLDEFTTGTVYRVGLRMKF